MTILTPTHLIALLPLLIVGMTVLVLMLAIAWRRDHFVGGTITVMGLNLALLSLVMVWTVLPIAVTPLIQVNGFSLFYTALVLIAGLASCTFAYGWLEDYPDNKEEFYLLVLIATMGGILLTMADHLAALFVGIELLSLPLFGLVGYAYRQNRSLEAAIKYTILSAVASSFLLFGMALLYAESGSLTFAALGADLSNAILHRPILLAGVGMLLVGLGFKLSLVPFQLWTPDVYQGSPAPVTTFLATAGKIAIFAVLIRLFYQARVFDNEAVRAVLAVMALLSILFGNILALKQNNIKRMLGYSSIAHFGYLLVLLIVIKAGALPETAVALYLTAYLLSSLAAFGVVSLMSSPYRGPDAEELFSYRGLFWHKPVLSAVMTVALLSLAGIPTTLGFIGKFNLLAVTVANQLWWLSAAIVVGSAIGIYYYMRTIVSLYLHEPRARQRDSQKNWALTAGGVVVLISAVLVLLLGVYPQPLFDLIEVAQKMQLSINNFVH